MSRHDGAGLGLPPVLTGQQQGDGPQWGHALAERAGYHSVAGQPAAALQGGSVKPLTLVDFIDARVREIDAERNRLSMLREQLTASGVTIAVEDLRRVLG